MARALGYGTDARLVEITLGEPEPVVPDLPRDEEARCAERVREAYAEQSALLA